MKRQGIALITLTMIAAYLVIPSSILAMGPGQEPQTVTTPPTETVTPSQPPSTPSTPQNPQTPETPPAPQNPPTQVTPEPQEEPEEEIFEEEDEDLDEEEIEVEEDTPKKRQTLPFTGSNSSVYILLGTITMIGGTALLRKRITLFDSK